MDLINTSDTFFNKSAFTIVGNPTITDDGVASGFSVNDYVSNLQDVDFTKPFEISGYFNSGDITKSQAIFTLNPSARYLFGGIHSNGYPIIYFPTSSTTTWAFASNKLLANTNYYCAFTYDGTTYQFKVGLNKDNLNIFTPKVTPTLDYTLSNNVLIGRNMSGAYLCNGSIDLKSISITVDGQEVFSGKTTVNYSNKVFRFAPDIYTDNETMIQVYKQQEQQLSNTESLVYQVFLNNYVKTCDLEGIRNFEKIFDIQADEKNDSMDLRKNRVLIKLSQHLPFTHIFVERMLANIFGEDKTEFRVLNNEYKTQVDIKTTIHGLVDETLKDLRQIIPANMIIEIILSEPYMHKYLAKYYTYGQLEEFTYGQLSQYA